MGSVQIPELNSIAQKIWKWCEVRDIWLHASYISSADNKVADEQTRLLPTETEWELHPKAFEEIELTFGSPDIDIFASYQNNKCKKYISWKPDPFSVTTDAFTVPWNDLNFYAFPPFALILRSLNKIIKEKAVGIMVVPLWEAQPWYPLFKKLLIANPIYLPLNTDNNILISPYREHKMQLPVSSLVVGKLSGAAF